MIAITLHTIRRLSIALVLIGLAMGALHCGSTEPAPVLINADTSWCWFQDERAVIHDGKLLLAGVSAAGDITVTAHDLRTGENTVAVLHERLESNDHAVPALYVRPDGRYLAVYSRHNDGNSTRWRITERPGDITSWQPEQQFDNGALTTYSNLYHMSAEGLEGRLYNFTRTRGWDPNFLISDDHGATWEYGGRLIDGGGDRYRPYPRYAGNGVDRIHFITTEQHPRDFANSIYHGYISGGRAFRSDGTVVNEDIFGEDAPRADAFTKVFSGDASNVAWTSDIHLDANEHPYIAYSVKKDSAGMSESGLDHRYRYARWDGSRWHDYEIAYGGTRLYRGEDEYTGLIALHPANPDVVFISANVHPATGEPILVKGVQRYEIFRGQTRDRGASWTWQPVTSNSPLDNLRPIVVADRNTWAVVWLQGEYRSYTDHTLAAVGLLYGR